MHPLVSILLAFASASCFANQTTGPGNRHLYRGSRALGPVTRPAHDPSPTIQHHRMAELMKRADLRYLMFMPASADPVHAEYGYTFPVLIDEVAGPFVRALVELEVAASKHFEVPFDQVCAETDLLLSLATPHEDTSAAAVLAHLRATEHRSLGPWYDELFLRALRRTKVREQGAELPALAARFLPNLAGRLTYLAGEGRRALAAAKPRGTDPRVKAWLRASRPTRPAQTLTPEIPFVEAEDRLARRPSPKPALRPEMLAACLKHLLDQ